MVWRKGLVQRLTILELLILKRGLFQRKAVAASRAGSVEKIWRNLQNKA